MGTNILRLYHTIFEWRTKVSAIHLYIILQFSIYFWWIKKNSINPDPEYKFAFNIFQFHKSNDFLNSIDLCFIWLFVVVLSCAAVVSGEIARQANNTIFVVFIFDFVLFISCSFMCAFFLVFIYKNIYLPAMRYCFQ